MDHGQGHARVKVNKFVFHWGKKWAIKDCMLKETKHIGCLTKYWPRLTVYPRNNGDEE